MPKLPQSINEGSSESQKLQIDLNEGSIETPQDQALEAVQRELESERDARKEERFVWLCVCILIFDIFAFQSMETWSGPVMIGLIQLIFIVALGRKWGMATRLWSWDDVLARIDAAHAPKLRGPYRKRIAA